MLATALKASPEVPKIDVVTERLIHKETKQKEANHQQDKKAMTSKQNNKKGPKCHFCGKQGHFKQDCFNYIKSLLYEPQEITVGDGFEVRATGIGTLDLFMKLPDSKTNHCRLSDVLYVPKLS